MNPRETTPESLESALGHFRAGGPLELFLDYDGTLVPIAPTPGEARPDAELLDLLARLVQLDRIRVAILSGRPLSSLAEMLPVPGLRLAGTYGLELQTLPAPPRARAEITEYRPTIERVKRVWADLVHGRSGFMLEDKGLAFALHARFAAPADAEAVLPQARRRAVELVDPQAFRILGGDRFLEVAPAMAHKGRAVEWLLANDALPEGLPVYFGDDDKDEEAFEVVRERGGVPVVVGVRRGRTAAVARLASPADVRNWLRQLVSLHPLSPAPSTRRGKRGPGEKGRA